MCTTDHMRVTVDAPLDPVRSPVVLKTVLTSTTAAAALTAGVLGFAAPALAAPSGAGSAADTISALEAQGNRVVVNFAEAGKQVVEGSRVQLQLVVGETDMDLDLNSTPAGVKHP